MEDSSPQTQLPTRVYSPDSALLSPGKFFSDWAGDLKRARELAWRLTVRDFKALYRQSFAGYLWAFIPPLFASLTFILLREGNVVQFGETGIPYPAFVIIGTLLWQVFVDALNSPIRIIQSSAPMLMKINFPRDALILSAIQMSLINLAIRLSILIPVLFYYRFPWSNSIFLAPLGLLILVLIGSTIGLFLATAGLLYHDFQRGLQVITTFWMFLTPVLYPGVKEGFMGKIMLWNPVTSILVTTRDWMTGMEPTLVSPFLLVSALTLISLIVAAFVYRLFLPRIIERLGM